MIRAGRRLSQHLSAALARRRDDVVVLAYHLVGAGTGTAVDLPLDDFQRQLDLLQSQRRVLPLTSVVERLAAGEEVRGPTAVLTFDDAYRNFRTHAWPRLREAGLPATLFVPVGFVDGTSPPPLSGADLAAMSWEELREMATEGLEVGSHSLTHPDLRRLGDARLAEESSLSRQRLEDEVGRPVTCFAYPRALWDRRVEAAAAAVYRSAFAAGGRHLRCRALRRPHRLPRVPVRTDLAVPFQRFLDAPLWIEEWLADRVRRW